MKKLLYILTAVLLIVSCEKDNLNAEVDASSINAIVESQHPKHDAAKAFLDSLIDSDIMVERKSNKDKATAKAGDQGTNWLQIFFFNVGTQDFAFLRSDSQGEACATEDQAATEGTGTLTDVSEVIYTLTDTQLHIETDGVVVSYTVPVESYTSSFDSDGPDAVIPMNEERTAAAAAQHSVTVSL